MASPERLPDSYHNVASAELIERIAARRQRLASSLCILGHHYQRDEVVRFADHTGDSLKLSQIAAAQKQARYIVFCGVHFMAESADILSADDQAVLLPNMLAGCAMADLAEDAAVENAVREVQAMSAGKVVPITYVNSTAAIKAITARAGGACCTSSNVRNVFEWALTPAGKNGASGRKVFAIPDQHLGRNTAVAMGYDLDDCAVYDPHLPDGGLTGQDVGRATFILWKGHCYVHQVFRPEHVEKVRRDVPGVTVIVHPECPHEVVRLSDASGSTEQIIRAIAGAEPASKWAVGTESNLVNRLARRHADRFVRVLSDAPAICAQMARIDLAHLLWILDGLAEEKIINQVSVPSDIAADARIALERMISIKALKAVTRTSTK